MSDFSPKLEEITQILVSLDVGASKSLAYSTLLRLQEQSVSDHNAIAVQAMKCLGFMIHHPTILASILVGVAGGASELLATVIITAKK